jgi:hypothetical protein
MEIETSHIKKNDAPETRCELITLFVKTDHISKS